MVFEYMCSLVLSEQFIRGLLEWSSGVDGEVRLKSIVVGLIGMEDEPAAERKEHVGLVQGDI